MDGVLDANPSRPTRSIPMAVVISEMSMSLDSFVADPADQVGPLFDWYANGEVEVPTAVPERWTFRTSEASAGYLRESMGRIGALVAGRRLFDIGRWGEHGHPYGVPVFVVTHDVPQGWPREDAPLPITFVTDGVEHAVAQAKTTAGEGWVGVAGPTSPSSAWTPACSTRCGSTWCPSCSARASATSTSSRTRRSHWRIHGSSRALASPISSTASPGSSAPALDDPLGPGVAGRTPGRPSAGARAAGGGGRGRLGRRRLGAAVLGRGLGRRGCRLGGLGLVARLGSSRLRFAGHQALRLVRLVGQAAPDLLNLAAGRARHPFLADVHGLADLIGQPLHPRVVQECPRRLHDLLVALTTSLGPEHVSGAEADQQASPELHHYLPGVVPSTC